MAFHYLFYVDVDRLASTLGRVNFLFNPSFAGSREAPAAAEHVESANELFGLLDKQLQAIVRWLYQMHGYTSSSPSDLGPRKRLEAHVPQEWLVPDVYG